jgi:hypothetical protein
MPKHRMRALRQRSDSLHTMSLADLIIRAGDEEALAALAVQECTSTPKLPQFMNRQITAVAGNQTERVVSARGPSLVGLSRAPSAQSR